MACRVIEKVPDMMDWLAMMVATVASATSGSCRLAGLSMKKEFRCGRHPADNQHRSLAGIVQNQGRQDQSIPCQPDRLRAEMAHVGDSALRAGSAQEHAAEHQKSGKTVAEEISEANARIKRCKYVRMLENARNAKHADRDEPDHHDRAK